MSSSRCASSVTAESGSPRRTASRPTGCAISPRARGGWPAARAREVADSAVAEPAFPGLAPPTAVPDVDAWDEETASLGPEEQARRAAAAIGATDGGVYGFFTSGTTELAVATSTGVSVSQPMTDAMTLVVAA